jgi:hypothetical protein
LYEKKAVTVTITGTKTEHRSDLTEYILSGSDVAPPQATVAFGAPVHIYEMYLGRDSTCSLSYTVAAGDRRTLRKNAEKTCMQKLKRTGQLQSLLGVGVGVGAFCFKLSIVFIITEQNE